MPPRMRSGGRQGGRRRARWARCPRCKRRRLRWIRWANCPTYKSVAVGKWQCLSPPSLLSRRPSASLRSHTTDGGGARGSHLPAPRGPQELAPSRLGVASASKGLILSRSSRVLNCYPMGWKAVNPRRAESEKEPLRRDADVLPMPIRRPVCGGVWPLGDGIPSTLRGATLAPLTATRYRSRRKPQARARSYGCASISASTLRTPPRLGAHEAG